MSFGGYLLTALRVTAAGALICTSGCGKKTNPKPSVRPLIIESIRVSFPAVVPDYVKHCRNGYFEYELDVANAKYSDDGDWQRHAVRLDLSLSDRSGRSVWKMTRKPDHSGFLKMGKLQWVGSGCIVKPLKSGTYTFQIHAVDKEGGGKGTGKRTVEVTSNAESPDSGPRALLPGHTRLPMTGLQLALPGERWSSAPRCLETRSL